MNTDETTKVGIGVLVMKDGKVLLGKRKGSHGAGEYAGTGGHLEHMESFESCAKRETLEETGLEIENVRFLCISNLKDYAPKHYVDIGLVADWKSGVPQVMEESKIEQWDWYDLDAIPASQFGALSHYFEALKTGRNYFDN